MQTGRHGANLVVTTLAKCRARPTAVTAAPIDPAFAILYACPMAIDEHTQVYLERLGATGVRPVTELSPQQARAAAAELIPQQVGDVEDVASVEDAHGEVGELRVPVQR